MVRLHDITKSGFMKGGALIVLFFVCAALLVSFGISKYAKTTAPGETPAPGKNITAGDFWVSSVDIKIDAIPLAPSAQDAEADIDIDMFEYNTKTNQILIENNFADCTNAVPAIWDGTGTVTLTDENYCILNTYKYWSDSNFNAGDSETQLTAEGIRSIAADYDDVDGTGTTEKTDATPGEVIFVTIKEQATTDDEDIVPHAFLIQTAKKVASASLAKSINDGDENALFKDYYYSHAGAESKLSYGGSCKDNQGHSSISLDSNWHDAIDTSLTTATTVNLDCKMYIEITDDGYALPLVNSIAETQAEHAYVKFTPHGESYCAGTEAWQKYGTCNYTGDVQYSTSDTTDAQTLWEGSYGCGSALTSDSGTDSVALGDEKLYFGTARNDCTSAAKSPDVKTKYGITGIFDEGARLYLDISVDGVKVDYDAAQSGSDETVGAASHAASTEAFFNVTLVTTESVKDYAARNLSG